MRLFLISSSYVYGRGYLDHCIEELASFLGPIREVLFLPFALHDYQRYAISVEERFEELGVKVTSIHLSDNPKIRIEESEAIFVGGGNTFRLLRALYDLELLSSLGRRVAEGVLYIGSSAGANIACPTIRTTNDMPIVPPPSFQALNLVPFNINPHYIEPATDSRHMGESRDARIREFHEENNTPVLALREGSTLRREASRLWLSGIEGAKLFMQDQPPSELGIGASLDFLLLEPSK